MAYTTDGIAPLSTVEHDGGVIVRAACEHTDKVVQLYVSGRLAAWADHDQSLEPLTQTGPPDPLNDAKVQ